MNQECPDLALQFEHFILQAKVLCGLAQDAESALVNNDVNTVAIALNDLKECAKLNIEALSGLRDTIRLTLPPQLIPEFDRKAAEIDTLYELHRKFFGAIEKYGMGNA